MFLNYFVFDTPVYKLKFIFLSDELAYFIKHETTGKMCCTGNEIIGMLKFLIHIILFDFRRHIIKKDNRHPHGDKLFPLLVNE
jgi:hypothetical protein